MGDCKPFVENIGVDGLQSSELLWEDVVIDVEGLVGELANLVVA